MLITIINKQGVLYTTIHVYLLTDTQKGCN